MKRKLLLALLLILTLALLFTACSVPESDDSEVPDEEISAEEAIAALKAEYEAKLAALKATGTANAAEIEALKKRISELEAYIEELENDINTPATHTVTFDTGEGGPEIAPQAVAHGEKITEPDVPVMENSIFVCWLYDDIVWVFEGYVATEDMTLTAVWAPCPHTNEIKDLKCDICGIDLPCPGHEDIDDDKLCDLCGHDMTTKTVMKPLWDSANIIMQLNLSDNEELSSELIRYVKGSEAYSKRIDKDVASRNIKATEITKVSVTYKYWDNISANGLGATIGHIEDRVTSTTIKDAPDVYSTFIYDLIGSSVKGYFANLKGTTRGSSVLKGLNYFEFVYDKSNYENELFQTGNDRGFMYEWMESVTLDPNNRMYVLASDYLIDMARAQTVIPFNVALLEDVGWDITDDWSGDDEFSVADFYQQVKAGEWTYDLMMEYAAAVYSADSDGETGKWIGDETVGFALSDRELSTNAMVYSAPIQIINKDWNEQRNDWDYSYPNVNDIFEEYGLAAFTDAIGGLLAADGVIFVGTNQRNSPTDYSAFGDYHFAAIRNRFSEGHVLFGDVTMVGSLEHDAYQEMGPDAFGVVPIPIFHSNIDEDGNVIDSYNTQIHNVGRAAAIAYNTKKFVECTAFLNYQSTHSEIVIDTYFTYELCYGSAGGEDSTVEMFKYIYDNVGSGFDKAMEDAMGVFNADAKNFGIATILNGDKDFNVPDIRDVYGAAYQVKTGFLNDLVAHFQSAKD